MTLQENSALFMLKTVILRLIKLLPLHLLNDKTSFQYNESKILDDAIKHCEGIAELNYPEKNGQNRDSYENFIGFMEASRLVGCNLIELDSYYRMYVEYFFDFIHKNWRTSRYS